MRIKSLLFPTFFFIAPLLLFTACSNLKTSRPIMPVKEYEKMLVGSLEAEYIGNDKCLETCHDHDAIASNLRISVHGQQTESGSGMPLVNCETCHGGGSLAVAHAKENKKCDPTQFIQVKELPAAAQSLICLKCHSSYSMASMQYWAGSRHNLEDVACSDCHDLHAGPEQKLSGEEISSVCFVCHPEVRSEFSFFSRHPVLEGRMTCASCHAPHGSINEMALRTMDMQGLCVDCHGEKVGPFLYEHADVTDDCANCHSPHGSPFSGLLRYQEPFLCFQCHQGHTELGNEFNPAVGYKRGFNTRCTNCHAQVHGSDTGGGTSSGLIE